MSGKYTGGLELVAVRVIYSLSEDVSEFGVVGLPIGCGWSFERRAVKRAFWHRFVRMLT